MGRTNTKKMVQGAMIAAIFGALSLINTYTGSMFDIFICYVMVIPLVWYGYTYTFKDNVIVCIVSMLVIAMMGLPFFVISSFSSCLAGLFIGEALKRKAKKETIMFGTMLVMFFNNILLYEVFAGLLGIDLVAEMKETYTMMTTMMPTMSETLSLDFFLSLIPLVLLLTSAMEMYVVVMLCQLILTRLKITFPGSFHLALMHIGKKTGIFLAGMVCISVVLQSFFHIEHIVLTYMQMIGIFAFMLQGIAFLSYILILKGKAKWMILVFVGIFIPGLQMFYLSAGIVDIFSDLRGDLLYNKNSSR